MSNNASALVYCLLDSDEDYAPDGYKLLSTARAGDYWLKLWRGRGHVNGAPLDFNEVSLNAVGRSFDLDSQRAKFPGGVHALGHRAELLQVVAQWIKQYGVVYIGSHVPAKLSLYHRLFKHYLAQLKVSEPYAPFDECGGQPEYFKVGGGDQAALESLLEGLQDAPDPRYLEALPSVFDRAVDSSVSEWRAQLKMKPGAQRELDSDWQIMEEAVGTVVHNLRLTTGDEVVDTDFFNSVLQEAMQHVYDSKFCPS